MNIFNGNVRDISRLNDDELRASLKVSGWHKELPAIKDENGELLVGYRRMKIATEEGITPVIRVVTFGTGPDAEAERVQLAYLSNVGGVGVTAEDRKRHAERMYAGGAGMTMEAIGMVLGVDKATISRDVKDIVAPCNNVKPDRGTDTKGRKKSTGRPKNSPGSNKKKTEPKPVPLKEEDAKGRVAGVDIKVAPPVWKAFDESARREGKSATAKISELVEHSVSPPIDISTLAMSAREKLTAAINQEKHKLEVAFRETVRIAVDKGAHDLLDYLLKDARKKEKEDFYTLRNAHSDVRKRAGIITKATYNLIRSCLHPDSRKSVSDEKLAKAFHQFEVFERLVGDAPVLVSNIPDMPEDMAALKEKVKAENRAKREASSHSKNVPTKKG